MQEGLWHRCAAVDGFFDNCAGNRSRSRGWRKIHVLMIGSIVRNASPLILIGFVVRTEVRSGMAD
ncbi:MAG: hypothetical protein ABI180_00920 [Microcoleus sp.]